MITDRKELQLAFEAALTRHRMNQREFSTNADVDISSVHKAVYGKQRIINTEVLQKLTHAWPDPSTGYYILEAYLQTEIRRANHSPEKVRILIEATNRNPEIVQAVETINHHLHHDADLATLLIYLADTLKTSSRLAAAESRARYGSK